MSKDKKRTAFAFDLLFKIKNVGYFDVMVKFRVVVDLTKRSNLKRSFDLMVKFRVVVDLTKKSNSLTKWSNSESSSI